MISFYPTGLSLGGLGGFLGPGSGFPGGLPGLFGLPGGDGLPGGLGLPGVSGFLSGLLFCAIRILL